MRGVKKIEMRRPTDKLVPAEQNIGLKDKGDI